MAAFTTDFKKYLNTGHTFEYIIIDVTSTIETEPKLFKFTASKLVAMSTIALLILCTVFGNILTMVAIVKCKNLHKPANYLIASLSIADLMVAVFVMPLSLLMEIDHDWQQQKVWCDLWISLDVLCCTASILSLCVIALDRYWSITYPFTYKKKRTSKRILLMIMVVWLSSTLISVAPLLGWKTPEEKAGNSLCQISQDKVYTVFSTFGAFFIPMTIMLVVYYRIFLEVKRRVRGKAFDKYNPSEIPPTKSLISLNSKKSPDLKYKRSRTINQGRRTSPKVKKGHSCNIDSNHLMVPVEYEVNDSSISMLASSTVLTQNATSVESVILPENRTSANDTQSGVAKDMKSFSLPPTASESCNGGSVYMAALERFQAKQALMAAREHKAAQTLGIVTGVFLICWLPFFILALIQPFFETLLVAEWVQSLVLWLGYFNSMLNPLIYTKFNPEFQKAFHKTLRCEGTPVHV